ncbi:FAD:protein FMN transferase [Candidatus Chlorohelix sp.]|uniref:FAD:protein FMN transferase n=1 Tax=Candidatus Chlorohelix sp. TaxID=3139201 RepID=UPI00306FD8CE
MVKQGMGEVFSTFRAMNTDVQALIYLSSESKATKLRARDLVSVAQLIFRHAELTLSRFLPDSELSRLNQKSYIEQASPLFFECVIAALKMAEVTGGIFDLTILDALEHAGYDRSFEQIGTLTPGLATKINTFRPPSHRYVELNHARRSIKLEKGARIDLGGIAKGMTVDRVAAVIQAQGFKDFMVSAGGDMRLGGNQPGKSGWEVEMQNPIALEGTLTTLPVIEGAVATSSTTRRRWLKGNQLQHHLIDPRTSEPVDNGLAAVTIVAPTAMLADVFAKTVLILGIEKGREFINRQENCRVYMIDVEGRLV